MVALGILILLGQRRIPDPDPFGLLAKFGAQRLGLGFHEVGYRISRPERVASPVAAGFEAEQLLQDFEVVRDGEAVAGVLVAEEVVPLQVIADMHSVHGSWVVKKTRSPVEGRSGIS